MEYIALKNICKINMGQSPDSTSYNKEKYGIPFFQGNADFGERFPITRVWCSSPIKIAKNEDILISVRAPIGAVNFAKEECCIGRGLASLTLDISKVSIEYIYWLLKAKNEELNLKGTGSTFKAISKKVLEDILVPDIELKKQNQCAEILDKTYNIIQKYREELTDLDTLIKARFVELFCNKGYPIIKWNDIFNTTTGKLDSNDAVEDGKYPFFTCAKEASRIDDFAFDQEALLLAGNNAAGKYDVKYYKGKFNAYQRTYVLSLKNDWSYQLFRYQLEDKLVYLQQQSLGGLTKYLTMKILETLEFVVPPKIRQIEFENFVAQVDKSKLQKFSAA